MVNMSAVTASKLFRTSTRQKQILGKVGLVTSSGALSVQDPVQLDVNVVTEDSKEEDNTRTVSNKDATSEKPKERVVVSPNVKHGDDDLIERSSDDGRKDSEVTDVVKPDVTDTDNREGESVESSTVSASSLPRTDVTDNMSLEVKDIKGTLNSIDSTCGVSRVSVKDDKEVWIHYNDNVNLNDVMVDVIEYMNKYGYTYLEFNRLARSENAVVFVIIKSDTTREKKPTTSSEE